MTKNIRRYQGIDLKESFSADFLGLFRETPTLLIGEAEPFPTQLLPQGAVFLLQVLDGLLLVPIHPTSEGQHQKLKWQSVHLPGFSPAAAEEMGRNRRSSDRLSTRSCACFYSADFSHTTRA